MMQWHGRILEVVQRSSSALRNDMMNNVTRSKVEEMEQMQDTIVA